MRIGLAASILLLASCGTGSDGTDNNNHGYGFQYDAQGATGLKLRFSAMSPSDPIFASASDPAFYEDEFRQTKNCTGLSAPPPFVILAKDLAPALGLYYSGPSLIVVVLSRPDLVKHESVHYLLDVNTGDPDVNHKSHFFMDCV